MKVIIVGGGIGGLTTALCLHKIGIEVKVFESVSEIKPLGVGINLLPHCVRVLTNLGLEPKIGKIAVETQDLVYFDKFGKKFWEEPRGRFAGYKWQQFSIHRGEFQMLLFEETQKIIGEENIKTSHHLQSFEQIGEKVVAHFTNKNADNQIFTEEGDFLIGADGINSVVRKQLYPNEGPPKFSQNVLYRGTSLMKPFLTGASMAMIGHLRQKMVVYPIGPKLDENGDQLINWVGNLKENDRMGFLERDWNKRSDKKRLLEIYKKWQFDWLNVHDMIDKSEAIYEFPMSDRDPLPQWTFGRVTLLGDAAHPMYPIGSNGASQAILDADALVNAIVEEADIDAALLRYDKERVPATAKVVLQNRQKGPDEIMDLMEDRFPEGFTEDQIPHQELETIMSRYKQIAGFDVQSLNQKN
ncbi:5-methylphenazine-1-carboxylate 1-monooxygenase [Emticicia aquatica]|uniref:5-methylphenazine-1-carboxylate 1-monooxygenase n=1 Tax=Emticicia aquatica TaxID=1681835 RepID=A0ABM9ALP9_9BACT|nr:flavin-dependent oxidoreductase [Emticicia aquatica]CAH0994380.1 5-methylphenazine-1-carboxylate 1-monooxygenase [Emticicia aquatica]